MALMPLLWYVNTVEISVRKYIRRQGHSIGSSDHWTRVLGLSADCNANTKQYTAAVKTSSLDAVAKAVSTLKDVYHKDLKLATILEAPTLSVDDKQQIVAELQKHTGGADKEGTVKNFLSTLADYNRLGLLKGVCDKFGDLMSASKGEVELTVISAAVSPCAKYKINGWNYMEEGMLMTVLQSLDNRTLSRLETAVSKSQYVSQGKKLKVTNKVQPSSQILPLYRRTLLPIKS